MDLKKALENLEELGVGEELQLTCMKILTWSVMGLVCFIPFALYVRGAALQRNPTSS